MEGRQGTPKWDWIPCSYNLKTEVRKKIETWNLAPQVLLTSPNDDGQDPNVKLYIDTEKSLQYSDELGWNWHKSWNLPNISVRLEIKDALNNETLLCPRNIYVHMFAVKAVIDQMDHFHLADVGMRGNNKLELVNGQAFLSAIKFNSTSYNNEGVKFHLILCVYIQNSEGEVPKMLTATISPPIFVDSRKSARDQQVLHLKKMQSYVEPFQPDSLEKIFIKRENKKKNDTEIKIYNDTEGLFNYLTAPNIRHKVKHPLFLALKFSSCMRLFYNQTIYQEDNKEDILISLQKKLTFDLCSKIPGEEDNQEEKQKIQAPKSFIFYIQEFADTFKQKKIVEAIEALDCQSLQIIYKLDTIPTNFVNFCGNDVQDGISDTIKVYQKNFNHLMSISNIPKKIGGYDDQDETSATDDDDEDDDPDDQHSVQKRIMSNPPIENEKNMVKINPPTSFLPKSVETQLENYLDLDRETQNNANHNTQISINLNNNQPSKDKPSYGPKVEKDKPVKERKEYKQRAPGSKKPGPVPHSVRNKQAQLNQQQKIEVDEHVAHESKASESEPLKRQTRKEKAQQKDKERMSENQNILSQMDKDNSHSQNQPQKKLNQLQPMNQVQQYTPQANSLKEDENLQPTTPQQHMMQMPLIQMPPMYMQPNPNQDFSQRPPDSQSQQSQQPMYIPSHYGFQMAPQQSQLQGPMQNPYYFMQPFYMPNPQLASQYRQQQQGQSPQTQGQQIPMQVPQQHGQQGQQVNQGLNNYHQYQQGIQMVPMFAGGQAAMRGQQGGQQGQSQPQVPGQQQYMGYQQFMQGQQGQGAQGGPGGPGGIQGQWPMNYQQFMPPGMGMMQPGMGMGIYMNQMGYMPDVQMQKPEEGEQK